MTTESKYKDEDLIGKKFGRLTVKEVITRNKTRYCKCICDCGNERLVKMYHLIYKETVSCGCYAKTRATTHGLYYHPLYHVIICMIQRCTNKKDPAYSYYGGRGIKVYEKWKNHPCEFIKFAEENGWRKGLTTDRINPDGDYEPNNIRFVDRHTQSANRNLSKNNKTGYCGIKPHKNKFISIITFRGKNVYLGLHESKKDALDALNKYIIDNNLTEYKIQEWKGE